MDKNLDYIEDFFGSGSFGDDRDRKNVAGNSRDPDGQGGDVISLIESDDDVSFVSYAGMESSANFGASPINSVEKSTKRRRLASPSRKDKERERLTVGQKIEIEDRKNMIGYFSTEDASKQIIEWLSEVENCRKRSGSLKGSISKVMKVNLSAKGAIENIIARGAKRNKDNLQESHYQEIKEELEKLKEENRMLRHSVKLLTDKLNGKKARVERSHLEQSTSSIVTKSRLEDARGVRLNVAATKSSLLSTQSIPETIGCTT